MKKKISPFGLLMMSLVLTACATSIPSVTTLVKSQQAEQDSQTSVDAYVIGPGDILAIDVWKETELSKQVSVRLDGKISLPLIEEIQAAGLSTAELRNVLAARYKSYVEVPVVSVVVVESRSKKIYLLGKVTNAGRVRAAEEHDCRASDITGRRPCRVGGYVRHQADQEDQGS